MRDFKSTIYDNYYTVHNKFLYGEITIESIEKQFHQWKYYFGKYLPKDKTASILDAGCGYGGFIHWLNNLGFTNSSGIDISEELYNISRRLDIKNIFCDDIFKFLGSNVRKYDLIFARDLLEHFSKEKIFELGTFFLNSLKEDGVLILQVPNGQSPMVGKIFYGDFTHETIFTHISIRQLFIAIGFTKFLIREITPVPKNFISMSRFILWKFVRNILKLLQMIETGDSSGYFSQNIIVILRKK